MPTERRARELWFLAPGRVEVRGGAVPALPAGHVLARALVSGISQGTELLLYRGEGPTPFDPSLDAPGAPTYPRRYGYAWVGEIVERGPGGEGPPVGTRVFALAPHGDWAVLAAGGARVLDPATPARRGVLAANLETAVTCVWDSGVSLGDRVIVLGGGVVGLLVARLASLAGGRVRVVEPAERRRRAAAALGLEAIAPEVDLPAGEADIVVEATGDPSSLDRAIAHAGLEATVLVASFYGRRTAPVSLGAEFHRRRLSLRATQVSVVPPCRAPRWSPARRFDLVRSLLADPTLDALLDPPVTFDSAPDVYARIARAPGDAMQTVFVYA